MQFLNLLFVVLLSMFLSTFAFDVVRKTNPETSAVDKSEVSEHPEMPESPKLQKLVIKDIEIEKEGIVNRDGINQRLCKAGFHRLTEMV